ncbi:MAG: AI-2E family transporter [Peptococcaceae bacterium]|jgi:predicted PurR-regulated permease PerM|nr:AI-2E family transporter [Peptococcaceae bacterium]MDH7525146.1 AI-2E family transporter [Peptococcaceae bacterium]
MNVFTVWRKKWRLAGVLLVFVLLAWFFFAVRQVLVPFVIGFLMAYVLDPFVDVLENKGMQRGVSVALIYILVTGAIAVTVLYGFPALLADLNRLVDSLPRYTREFQDVLRGMQDGYNRLPLPDSIRLVIDETLRGMGEMAAGLVEGTARILLGLFSQAFNLVLAPVLSFYFLLEFNRFGRGILKVVPARWRRGLVVVGSEANQVIKRFIRGNILVSIIVAVMTTLGMVLIGMDFPLLIGLVVGLANLIPYFGAVISAVPAVLLALTKSRWMALYVLGVMILIQQIEGNIISPRVLGDSVGLHPLVIIFSLLAAGQLWGFMGMLFAVPLAGVIKVLLKHLYWRLL